VRRSARSTLRCLGCNRAGRWEPAALQAEAAACFAHASVGGQMTAAADTSGKVYTWGCGGSKRLGHSSFVNELVPRVVQALASVFVTRVSCAHMHAAAVTSVGSVFTWGDGEFGKLGHGDDAHSARA
jgi:alpha-tubulin suppressor-like RCC1 family protein